MSETKRIPAADFLIDSGLLFEINRTILHPLGLALEVIGEVDGSKRIESLWDYRDAPEGMLYEASSFEDGQAKIAKFMADFGTVKLAERERAIGFVVQERSDQ